MDINDPLHLAAYGIKRDYVDKTEYIQNNFYPQNPQKIFYPIDKAGVVDEWAALIKNQAWLEEQIANKKAQDQKQRQLSYKRDLEIMKQQKEDEKKKEKDRLMQEREELKYLDKELEEYNKMRKSYDRQQKQQNAQNLINQRGSDKLFEDTIRNRELQDMNDRIKEYQTGENNAKLKDLEKKAHQAKEMRDFMAYKQFQKEIDQEKASKDKQDYYKMLDDANRKQDEKDRRWRKFYEDFAHQQQGKISDYTQNVIMPLNERERMIEMKRMMDANELQNRDRDGYINGIQKKAMSQAEIDDFNKRQLLLKNQQKQNEQAKNLQYAEVRDNELQVLDQLTEQQKQELMNQRRLYGQTLQYQKDVQEQLRKNYGKMTMHEKKLNKIDLAAYKNHENQVYAVVPGIHHFDTVAAVTLAHKGAPQMDLDAATAGKSTLGDLNATVRDQNFTYRRKQQELEMKRQNTQDNNYSGHQSPSPQGSHQFFQKQTMTPMNQSTDGQTLNRYKSQATLGDAANHFEITSKNPIWNPLPNYNRRLVNPVQYQSNNNLMPNSSMSVLQTMAHNNILKQ